MRKARGSGVIRRLAVRLLAIGIVATVTAGTTGCLKKIILDGQISSTRKASAALNSTSDWEIARAAGYAGIAQFEGMRYLAPDNDDALFLLTRTWTTVAFGFIEDEMEQVEDAKGSSDPEYDFQKRRAAAAYERAVWYGKQ